jgi:chemotaxis response regulator CheB
VPHGVPMVRVLVVDDQVAYRHLLVRLLDTNGFDVVGEAGTGEDAVRQIEATVPDVVLLDVLLPDFDGFEVVRRVAAGVARPIIVFISSRQREDFGTFVDLGLVRGFISKDQLTVERLNGLLPEG